VGFRFTGNIAADYIYEQTSTRLCALSDALFSEQGTPSPAPIGLAPQYAPGGLPDMIIVAVYGFLSSLSLQSRYALVAVDYDYLVDVTLFVQYTQGYPL